MSDEILEDVRARIGDMIVVPWESGPNVYNSPEVSGEIPEEPKESLLRKLWNMQMRIFRYGWNAVQKEINAIEADRAKNGYGTKYHY